MWHVVPRGLATARSVFFPGIGVVIVTGLNTERLEQHRLYAPRGDRERDDKWARLMGSQGSRAISGGRGR
jgi:hypothetical protein